MSRLLPVFSALGAAALVLIVFFGREPSNYEAERFSHMFFTAKEPWLQSGEIPIWEDDVGFCIYGQPVNSIIHEQIKEVIDAFRIISSRNISLNFTGGVSECGTQTTFFVWVQEGTVYKQDAIQNYADIIRVKNVDRDVLDPHLYQSTFAQAVFLSDGYDVAVAITLNQIEPAPKRIAAEFIRANVIEELFQSYAIALDLSLDGKRHSILEERFFETPNLWQGTYTDKEAEGYLRERPKGICLWDIVTLVAMYGENRLDWDVSEAKRQLKARFKGYLEEAKALSQKPAVAAVFDPLCSGSSEPAQEEQTK